MVEPHQAEVRAAMQRQVEAKRRRGMSPV